LFVILPGQAAQELPDSGAIAVGKSVFTRKAYRTFRLPTTCNILSDRPAEESNDYSLDSADVYSPCLLISGLAKSFLNQFSRIERANAKLTFSGGHIDYDALIFQAVAKVPFDCGVPELVTGQGPLLVFHHSCFPISKFERGAFDVEQRGLIIQRNRFGLPRHTLPSLTLQTGFYQCVSTPRAQRRPGGKPVSGGSAPLDAPGLNWYYNL
jgi:hypothetical protein